jgi:hypothetical protein
MHPDTVDKQLSEKAAYMKRKRAEESGEKRKEKKDVGRTLLGPNKIGNLKPPNSRKRDFQCYRLLSFKTLKRRHEKL